MKIRLITSTFFIIFFIVPPLFARDADMEKEAQRYIRSLLREVPELAGKNTAREAREDILATYKRKEFFRLSSSLRKIIESRKNPVPDVTYDATLEKLKHTTTQSKEVKFIIKNASEKDVTGELRLLLFRLMEEHIEINENIRKNTLKQLLEVSRAYKSRYNKYAEKLSDLQIPPEISKFTDRSGNTHDWLYLGGTTKSIKRSSSRVIFCEPIANSEGNAFAINARGSRIPVHLPTLKNEINQLAETPKPKTQTNPTASPEAKKTTHEMIDYSFILKNQMKDIMILYLAHTIKNKQHPSSLKDLDLPPNLLKSNSPDNQSAKEWIFVPPTKTIDAAGGQVIFASPYMHNGEHYYIATITGNIESILPEDHQQILKKIASE